MHPTAFYGSKSSSWQLAGLTLSESTYPANLMMAAHQHETSYFGIVLNGSYCETIERKAHQRKQLTTVFHPQGETHAVAFHNNEARIFRIELGRAFRARVEQHTSIPDEPAGFQGGAIASLTLRLYNEYRNRDQWSPLAIEGLSLEIIAELSRSARKGSDRVMPRWLGQAREILVSRLADPPSLGEIAQEVGVHPVHLARAWRKHFHCAVGDFIRQLRIELACEKIAGSDAPLSQIALAVGFYDQSHFSNTFKRFVGFTPAAYRLATAGAR